MAKNKKPKAAAQVVIKPWLSARMDSTENRFIQCGNTLLLSKAFQSLRANSQTLYFCMAMESGGRRQYEFTNRTEKKYGIQHATAARSKKELIEKGFIEIAEKNYKLIFAFSNEWKVRTDAESE